METETEGDGDGDGTVLNRLTLTSIYEIIMVVVYEMETETMTIWTSGYADLFKARNSFSQGLSNTRVTGRIKKGTYREEQHLSFRGKFRVRKTEKVSTARIDGENLKVLQSLKRSK